MTDELVKRLRAVDHMSLEDCFCQSSLYDQAADRIEQLTAELADAEALIEAQAKDHASNNIRFAEAEHRAKTAEAERDRLREALEGLLTLVEHANFEEGWCCCGDDMLHHQNPMDCGHTPVDMGEYHASLAIKEARAALKGDSHE